MKDVFIKYKSVILFIVIFFGSYLLLSVLYNFYLKASADSAYYPDFFTELVAKQSAAVLEAFGYKTQLQDYTVGEGKLLTIDPGFSVNVVEGCNAISVIILFFSFVISFAQGFKKTFLFLLAGTVLIYIVNVLRIALLTVALHKYPEHNHTLHGVVFPALIYGMVLVLWIAWIRSIKSDKSDKDS